MPLWPFVAAASASESMPEARRLSGDDERRGSSSSPFMMAVRLETRKGDWLRVGLGAVLDSSPPRSLSRESSA